MEHRQDMTPKQRHVLNDMQYKARLQAKRGHNHTYWSDDKHDKLFELGWKMYKFPINHRGKITESDSTMSENIAVETQKQLITDGYLAKLFCGYDKNIQRIKTFSILYKLKLTNIVKPKK
jgi:hypothetical protein